MDPELAAALRLQKLPDGRYRGTHAGGGGGRVVFGGQLLAQIVMAAADAAPDKSVKSVQVIFVRGASLDEPVTLEAELMHAGRLYTSATVSVRQGARLCVRALVLLDRADVELARHGPAMPAVGGPDASSRAVRTTGGAEMRIVGDVDLDDPAATGPPELAVWVRFDAVPSGDAISRALLAFACEPFFFGTSLRPHQGLSQASAYRQLIPAVLTHSLFFHAPFSASDWLLLDLTSPHVGRGRIYGYGSVFTVDGVFVASINQENQLRPIREGPAAPA
ncbi:MAG TPA: acyl-CoA thioesterase domain-containing protein [Acidimicrobiales bacterium]|nr:acyl-CoA thioesterase domain-containing protein [Acidimicrobiales bacterium]